MFFDGFKFVLIDKLKGLDPKEWIMLAAAAVIAVVLIIYLVQRSKSAKTAEPVSEKKVSTTLILVHGSLCIALAFVLSYIKLFSMPLGGSSAVLQGSLRTSSPVCSYSVNMS